MPIFAPVDSPALLLDIESGAELEDIDGVDDRVVVVISVD
jgi:hypothetical protein